MEEEEGGKVVEFSRERGKVIITGIPSIPSIPGTPGTSGTSGTPDKPIIIPSQLYPLSGVPEVFYEENTEVCTDQQLKDIFDNTDASIGFCYTNIQNLADNLRKAGISKQRYKTYIGWLFIGEQVPIHHAFLVVDNIYLLDFSASRIHEQLLSNYKPEELEALTIEELRDKLANEFMKEAIKPHSQRATFGKALPSHVYIASPCKPNQGRLQYNKLIKSHPNHPCIRGTTPSGATDMQLRIIKKRQEGNERI